MTQRIFDTDNEEDMALLWSILPEYITSIYQKKEGVTCFSNWVLGNDKESFPLGFISITWHDKTEITRPIQEATEQDIGKLCAFWSIASVYIGKLCHIKDTDTGKYYEMSAPVDGNLTFLHCRRLTKQEIEELC